MTAYPDGWRHALTFLRDYGPHTMGPIEDEGAFAAAYVFMEFEKLNLVSRTDFGGGHVQFALTDAGLRETEKWRAA